MDKENRNFKPQDQFSQKNSGIIKKPITTISDNHSSHFKNHSEFKSDKNAIFSSTVNNKTSQVSYRQMARAIKIKVDPIDGNQWKGTCGWFGSSRNLQTAIFRRRKDAPSPDTTKTNQAICGLACNIQLYNAALHELRRRLWTTRHLHRRLR